MPRFFSIIGIYILCFWVTTTCAQENPFGAGSGGSGSGRGSMMTTRQGDSDFTSFVVGTKFGLKNILSNEIVLEGKYDQIYCFDKRPDYKCNNSLYIVRLGKMYALFDAKTKTYLLPFDFTSIQYEKVGGSSYFVVRNFDNKQAIYQFKQGNILAETGIVFQYDQVELFNDSLAKVTSNSLTGLYNLNRKTEVLSPKYTTIQKIDNKLYAVPLTKINLGEKTGYLDQQLKEVCPPVFDSVALVSNQNPFKALDNTLQGIETNLSTNQLLFIGYLAKQQYILNPYENSTSAEAFSSVLPVKSLQTTEILYFVVKKKDKFGVLLPNKTYSKELIYDSIYPIYAESELNRPSSCVLFLVLSGKQTTIEKFGTELQSLTLDKLKSVSSIHNGLVLTFNNGQKRMLDLNLNETIKEDFDIVYPTLYVREDYTETPMVSYVAKKGNICSIYSKKGIKKMIADSVYLIAANNVCSSYKNKYALTYIGDSSEADYKFDYLSKAYSATGHAVVLNCRIKDSIGTVSYGKTYFDFILPRESTGFKDLKDLGDCFMKALSSESDSALYDFAIRLSPNYANYEFFDTYGLKYEGFFGSVSSYVFTIPIRNNYAALLQIKNRLKAKGDLSSSNIRINEDEILPQLLDKELSKTISLKGTNAPISFVINANTVHIYF